MSRRRASAPPAQEGNLVKCLVLLSAWRRCCVCGSETLFCDERGRSDGDFECGECMGVRKALARRLRRTSLPARVRFHLRALWWTGNDNGEARP